jgi:hypothetical protein
MAPAGLRRGDALDAAPGCGYDQAMPILVLYCFAFALLVIAAFTAPPTPPANPWLSRTALIGLACWVAAEGIMRYSTIK